MAIPSNTSRNPRFTGSQPGKTPRTDEARPHGAGRPNITGSIQKSEIKLRSAK